MTANDFLNLLRLSQLVEDDQWKKFLGMRMNANGLATAMVRTGLITEWQSQKLLAGKWKGFILGKYKLLQRLGGQDAGHEYLAHDASTGQQVKVTVLPATEMPYYTITDRTDKS